MKIQIKSKRRSFNKYYRRPTKENWLNYTIERNKATQLVDKTRMSFERKMCADIFFNPKIFWQYVKAKNMKQNNLYEIKDLEGIVFTVDSDFEGCATLDNGNGSIYFTTKYILIRIDKLNCSKAAGSDGIHLKIIKKCLDIFSFILYLVFHKSIKEGTLPKQWKEGTVRALHKKRKKNVCSNNKPVSLTFDRVSHTKLIFKLSQIGIKCCILKWIAHFLFSRRQRVMVN